MNKGEKFKKFFHALQASSFALLLYGCGSDARQEPLRETPNEPMKTSGIRIVAFGDSLTAGKDLPDPDQQAYPAVLERMLQEQGYDVAVANAGHSGDTTFDALARLDYALAEGADIVLVALGSNDTFQGKRLADIEKNLNRIIDQIQEKGVQPILLAMRTYPNFGPDYTRGYEAIFTRVAERQEIPLAPFFLAGVVGVDGMLLSDQVHPNAQGHRRMAENILPMLEKTVRQRDGGAPRNSTRGE